MVYAGSLRIISFFVLEAEMNQKRRVAELLFCTALIVGGVLSIRIQNRLRNNGRAHVLSGSSLPESSMTKTLNTFHERASDESIQVNSLESLKARADSSSAVGTATRRTREATDLEAEIIALENEIERGDVIAQINSDRTDGRERHGLMGKIHRLADLKTRLVSMELDEVEAELRLFQESRK